jgi:hypothetical protein
MIKFSTPDALSAQLNFSLKLAQSQCCAVHLAQISFARSAREHSNLQSPRARYRNVSDAEPQGRDYPLPCQIEMAGRKGRETEVRGPCSQSKLQPVRF